MEQNSSPAPRRSSGGGTSVHTKKPLTKAQKKLRHNIIRYSIFAGFGISAILIVIGLIALGSAIVGHFRGDRDVPEEASSYMEEFAAVTPEPTPEIHTVTMMAVGDNLIHDTVYQYAQQPDGSYDFTEMYSYLLDDIRGVDLACIQQETIFVSDPSMYSNYPAFGTPAEMADSLTQVGFDVICHASNHTYDKTEQGINDSLAAWEKYPQITVLGIHPSQEAADEIPVVEKNGIRIAMLDYTYGMNYAAAAHAYTVDIMDSTTKEHIAEMIEKARGVSDIVVVFMHLGNEDQLYPSQEQMDWAQFFADNGVGLLIGTHPHVVEPTDILTGKDGNKMPVFYSLGNFVSSQKDNLNMLGGMANVTITKDDSGTYVSDFSISPLVTWIQSGGTVGAGYRFHILHLEDYTNEMAAGHIRAGCSPAELQAIWDEIFKDSNPDGTYRGPEQEAPAG